MKKLCAFLLATITVLSLVACGGYSKKEVAKYIDVVDYKKDGFVTKAEFDADFAEQLKSIKESYCAAVEVTKKTQIANDHIVNATYEAVLTIVDKDTEATIVVGEQTLVWGDRLTADSTSTVKPFDESLIGQSANAEKPVEIKYTFSSAFESDHEKDENYEEYKDLYNFLKNKQVVITVTILEVTAPVKEDDNTTEGENNTATAAEEDTTEGDTTEGDTTEGEDNKTEVVKIEKGSTVKLTYSMTIVLNDYTGSKKDITVGDTKLGGIISLDDVLKTITVDGTPKTESNSNSSSNSTSTTTPTVDYKKEFTTTAKLTGSDSLHAFLKDKDVTITGTVHSVKEVPAWTDALVKEKSEGQYKTIAELEDAIRDSVAANLALENLIDKSTVKKDLPKGDLEDEYEALENQMKYYYYMFQGTACTGNEALASFLYTSGSYFGLSMPDSTVETMCNTLAATAAATVKEKMLLYYVADCEGLEVTGDEYKAYVKEQAEANSLSTKEYVEQAGGKSAIKETILFTEVTDFLCKMVKDKVTK